MDASVVVWENWHEQVKQLFIGIHGYQKKPLAVCALGIILSGSAVLQRIAESLHLEGISQAKMPSIERREAALCDQPAHPGAATMAWARAALAGWRAGRWFIVVGHPFGRLLSPSWPAGSL